MVAPGYVDISHFRAPYKNWPFLSGYGDVALDPATAALVDVDKNGVRSLKPAVASAIMKQMGEMLAHGDAGSLALPGGAMALDTVKVSPANGIPDGPEKAAVLVAVAAGLVPKASDWIKKKLSEGKTVAIGSKAGIPGVVAPTLATGSKWLVAAKDAASIAGPGTMATTAILASPSSILAMIMSPIGMGAIALLIVGGAVLLIPKRRRAVANKRRRAHTNATRLPRGSAKRKGWWAWDWEGGGYNSHYGTAPEAIRKSRSFKGLRPQRLRPVTDAELRHLDSIAR